MDRIRWRRIEQAFSDLLCADDAARAELLAKLKAADATLYQEVQRLFDGYRNASRFLEQPAFETTGLPPAAAASATQIGNYRPIRLLGVGGMGMVYEAEQLHPRRRVALKLVRPDSVSEQRCRRFEHEIDVLARLDHPGIARIYEAGFIEGPEGRQPFFAMELVVGKPIADYAETLGLSPRRRLELMMRVCEAVQHAHQKGVIHRDLKPANILIDDSGQPKVLDFGIARVTDGDVGATTLHTEIGQLMGTLPYMSPEQAAGDPNDLDTRSDVYSLGILCFELLVGRLPYDLTGRTVPQAVRIIREQDAMTVGALTPALRGDLDTILAKALDKDRRRRYQSALELADDLRLYLSHEPIRARAPSASYRLRKMITRHRVAFGFAATLLIVLLATSAVASWLAVRFAEQRDLALEARGQETAARETAEQVAAFLETLFEQADPAAAKGVQPTVRELLDAGRSSLTRLEKQPLVQARLMTVMGSVYLKLGELDRAQELLEGALELRRRHLGDRHADLAQTLFKLSALHAARREPEKANAELRQALDILRASFGEEHALVAEAWEHLGSARFYARDFAAAADQFGRALAIRRRLFGEKHEEVAQSLANLSRALEGLGRAKEAADLQQQALAIHRERGDAPRIESDLEGIALQAWNRGDTAQAELHLAEQLEVARKAYREDHPRLSHVLTNYGFVVGQNHGTEPSEPYYREALAIRRAAYGNQHPLVADSLDQLGITAMELGDFQRAEELLTEMLAIRRRLFGPEHELVAAGLQSLGEAYRRGEKLDAARAAFEEELSIYSRVRGEDSFEAALVHQSLGVLFGAQRDRERAEHHDRRALAIYERLQSPNAGGIALNLGSLRFLAGDFRTAEDEYCRGLHLLQQRAGKAWESIVKAKVGLGAVLLHQGRPGEAEALVREAVTEARAFAGQENPVLIHPLVNYAHVLLARGEALPAEDLAREALMIVAGKTGAGQASLADALAVLGEALAARHRMAEAEGPLRDAVAIYRERHGERSWLTASIECVLGTVLLELGRTEECEPLLLQCHEVLKDLSVDDEAGRAARALASLYERTGRFVEAAEWSRKG